MQGLLMQERKMYWANEIFLLEGQISPYAPIFGIVS